MCKTLEQHGGRACRSVSHTFGHTPAITYIVAPHGVPQSALNHHAAITVTPQWIDCCIEVKNKNNPEPSTHLSSLKHQQEEKVIDASEKPELFIPGRHGFPLVGASKVATSISGFSGTERERIKRLVTLLGFSYSDRFSKQNSHLIVKSPDGPKYEKARQWGTAYIVSLEWLHQCAREGTIASHHEFTLGPTSLGALQPAIKRKKKRNVLDPSSPSRNTKTQRSSDDGQQHLTPPSSPPPSPLRQPRLILPGVTIYVSKKIAQVPHSLVLVTIFV